MAGARIALTPAAATMVKRKEHETAIVQLYEAEYGRLVQLARLLLRDPGGAEEVVQEAFARLYARWPRLRDPTRTASYVRSMVCNLARDRLRRRRLGGREPVADARPFHPDDPAVAGDIRRSVSLALDALPGRQRQAVVLRYWGEMTQREIADALGISEGSVKSHLHRGITALATSLEDLR
jgi:RNA polymerase sigma-70 factor (sigma-E family)